MLAFGPRSTRACRRPCAAERIILFIAIVVLLLGGLLAMLWPERLHAQASPLRTVAVVILRGNDTLVVNRVQRTETGATTVIAARGAPRVTIVSTFGPDHLVREATFLAQGAGTPDDAPPLQAGSIRFVGDTAFFEVRGGASQRIPTTAGALLIANNDVIPVEQLVRRARAAGVTRLVQPMFTLTGGQTVDGTLELIGRDSARFTIAGNVTEVSIDAAGHVTGGRVPAQGIEIKVVEGAAAARISAGRPDYSPPAGAPYTTEEVTVRTPAGHTLAGTLTLPTGTGGRVPAAVTITGSGLQDRDETIAPVIGYRPFRQVADTLGRRGIAVLRMDDRGVGGSGGDIQGTSADFADDIRAGVAYLRQRPEIDPDRIALVGHSEGGLIAPLVAATDPRLAAIVLMAGPSQTGRRIIDYQLDLSVRYDTTIAADRRDSARVATGAQFDSTAGRTAWMRYFLAYDPIPTLSKVRQPVLVLHGATDRQVTVEQAHEIERALRAAGNTRVTTHVFPDRNHLFLRDANGSPLGYSRLPDTRIDGEVMGTLADWLTTTLGR